MGSTNEGRTPRLVITGAPGSGKTEFFNRLKTEPAFSEFLFFEEIARQLLDEKPKYRDNWAEFHREIYHRQTQQEEEGGLCPFVTDRGTLDAFAFHHEGIHEHGIDIKAEYLRYTGVIQLGSPATLAGDHYRRDALRIETRADSLANEKHLRLIWGAHNAFYFVEAAADVETKYQRFLETMLKLIRTK